MAELYRNARVLTMDPAAPRASGFLVEGGRFAALGDEAEQRAGSAEVVDLEGRVVVPGLIDAHTHIEATAVTGACWFDVRGLMLADALPRIEERVRTLEPGRWLIAQGTRSLDRAPLRAELDAIAPENPVMFRADMHMQTANTRALAAAGLLDRGYQPPGVAIERDPDGEPNGTLHGGFQLFPVDLPEVDELSDILERFIHERFSRFGVTSIFEIPNTRQGMLAYQKLEREGRLDARIGLYPTVGPGPQALMADNEVFAQTGLASGFGSDMVWFGGLKYFVEESATVNTFHTIHMKEELVRSLYLCFRNGIQAWMHAPSPVGQAFALDAIEEARRLHGGDGGTRPRIEHLGLFFLSDDVLTRVKELGVLPVPNPSFIDFWGTDLTCSYRTLTDAGLRPPGNSDTSGGAPRAMNPWHTIERMTTRINKDGIQIAPQESISVLEGIRAYTEFAALSGHRDGKQGVIARGALADFAVLSEDPLTIPADEIEERVHSVRTVVGGRTVWQA